MQKAWKSLSMICGDFGSENAFKGIVAVKCLKKIQAVHNIGRNILVSASTNSETGVIFSGKDIGHRQTWNGNFLVFEISK
jgi:hypothetical protein